MKINVAENAGFCFGVRLATEAVERSLEYAEGKIYTLGRLIHNDSYTDYLADRGVVEISCEDIDKVFLAVRSGEKATVVVRAHGETAENMKKLTNFSEKHPSLTVLDCTCPYVNKVRRIAAENSGTGKLFILIGAKWHPEVKGIMSCVAGDGLVFADSNELASWLASPDSEIYKNYKVSLAAQTTQNLDEWKKCQAIIKKVYTNALIFDTICNVTEKRQIEAKALAENSDAVLIIGSRGSSNTVKLFEICRSICPSSYLIEKIDDLKDIKFGDEDIISITAGASTPFSIIQEVKQTYE